MSEWVSELRQGVHIGIKLALWDSVPILIHIRAIFTEFSQFVFRFSVTVTHNLPLWCWVLPATDWPLPLHLVYFISFYIYICVFRLIVCMWKNCYVYCKLKWSIFNWNCTIAQWPGALNLTWFLIRILSRHKSVDGKAGLPGAKKK